MDDGEFQQLVEALRDFDGAGPQELQHHLTERIGLDDMVAAGIVSMGLSLVNLRTSNDWSLERAGQEIASAVGSPAESDPEREALASRIEQILGTPSLETAAKIGDAVISYERSWRGAEFLTDVRVVHEHAQSPITGVIITSLEIAFWDAEAGGVKRAYFALDDADLDDLADALSEARDRVRGLREQLRSSGVRLAATAAERESNA